MGRRKTQSHLYTEAKEKGKIWNRKKITTRTQRLTLVGSRDSYSELFCWFVQKKHHSVYGVFAGTIPLSLGVFRLSSHSGSSLYQWNSFETDPKSTQAQQTRDHYHTIALLSFSSQSFAFCPSLLLLWNFSQNWESSGRKKSYFDR